MKRGGSAPGPVLRPAPGGYHAVVRVDPELLRARYAAGCDTCRCTARCCRSGVWLDPRERDVVLDHADAVREAMDEDQPRDPRHWFSRRSKADSDFPSGRAVYTRVRNGRCVFLNRAGLCVLQKAAAANGGVRLKPFFCTAFPVTVDHGVLTLDEGHCAERPCCATTAGGPRTVFETCRSELRHVLGAAGVRRLRRLATRSATSRRHRRTR